jgi:hypothetical protein
MKGYGHLVTQTYHHPILNLIIRRIHKDSKMINLEDQTPQLIGHHKTREKGLKNHGDHG